jgi:hypothetical protein
MEQGRRTRTRFERSQQLVGGQARDGTLHGLRPTKTIRPGGRRKTRPTKRTRFERSQQLPSKKETNMEQGRRTRTRFERSQQLVGGQARDGTLHGLRTTRPTKTDIPE